MLGFLGGLMAKKKNMIGLLVLLRLEGIKIDNSMSLACPGLVLKSFGLQTCKTLGLALLTLSDPLLSFLCDEAAMDQIKLLLLVLLTPFILMLSCIELFGL